MTDQELDVGTDSPAEVDFKCATKDLIYGMDIVKRSIGTGRDMPILSGVKLEIRDEELKLTSTDLEMTTRCTVPISNLEGSATVVLKGDVLAKIMQRIPEDGEVRLKSDPEENQKVELSSGPINFDLFQLSTEDYPSVDELPEEPVAKINVDELKNAIKQTTFAALKAKETTRLSLTGVKTIFEEDQLKMVATNGYRMSVKTIPLSEVEEPTDLLIESGALTELDRILSGTESDEVSVYASKSEVFFVSDDVVFSDKLIMEQFPEYEAVIPDDNELPLKLDRSRAMETLGRAEITASEESGAVQLRAEEGSDGLTMYSSSPEKGELEEVVELLEPSNGDVEISFKAEFLIDALRRMSTDKVVLWLLDSETAGLLEPAKGEGDFLYVCMPISAER
ncbi:DNA polymerase III subunit beta [Candidatus Bipolaricaulota bacterium]|nr:DNA polymerase III subunit beta [Candidatus Bipolaricaulota bacterium]